MPPVVKFQMNFGGCSLGVQTLEATEHVFGNLYERPEHTSAMFKTVVAGNFTAPTQAISQTRSAPGSTSA